MGVYVGMIGVFVIFGGWFALFLSLSDIWNGCRNGVEGEEPLFLSSLSFLVRGSMAWAGIENIF